MPKRIIVQVIVATFIVVGTNEPSSAGHRGCAGDFDAGRAEESCSFQLRPGEVAALTLSLDAASTGAAGGDVACCDSDVSLLASPWNRGGCGVGGAGSPTCHAEAGPGPALGTAYLATGVRSYDLTASCKVVLRERPRGAWSCAPVSM